MVGDVGGDGEDALLGLVKDVGTREFLLQVGGLFVGEVFAGLAEEIVDGAFAHRLWRETSFVEQRHNGLVVDGLLDGINGFDDATESQGGVLVFLHQRRAGEGDFASIG